MGWWGKRKEKESSAPTSVLASAPSLPKRFKPAVIEVTGGLIPRHHTAIWTIKSYVAVLSKGDLINSESMTMITSDSSGNDSSWTFSFKPDPSEAEWLGIKWQLSEMEGCEMKDGRFYSQGKPTMVAPTVCAKVDINIKDEQGDSFFSNAANESSRPGEVSLGSEHLEERVIRKDWKMEDLPLINDDLVITIRLTTYSPPLSQDNTAETIAAIDYTFNDAFIKKYDQDLPGGLKMINLTSTVILVTNDKKEVKVSRELLTNRNEELRRILSATEKHELEYIGEKNLQILVDYWFTGRLNDSWANSDNVEEFLYAVGKLGMKEVLEYLDVILGKKMSDEKKQENLYGLIQVVSKLQLKNAEKELWQLAGGKAKATQKEEPVENGGNEEGAVELERTGA